MDHRCVTGFLPVAHFILTFYALIERGLCIVPTFQMSLCHLLSLDLYFLINDT